MARKTYMQAPNGEVFETDMPEYHKDCADLGHGQKGYAARQAYARRLLRESIQPGQVVYYSVRRVSSSGMSRNISFFIVDTAKHEPGYHYIRNIDNLMSDAIGHSLAPNGEGLRFGGCGMNMGFSGVYSLGRALFPDGFGTMGKKDGAKDIRATSHRHAKALQKRGYVFRGRNGDSSGWDNDGGYALGYTSI